MNEPKLRFPEFSGEWEEKTLGEVCDSILVGFPFKGEDITDDASGHPILRAFSIGEGIIRHGKDYDKYYPYDAEKLKKYEVRKGDIVISMDGSVGKNIAMVSEKEERNLLIQRVARLRITNYPIHLIFQQIISQRFKDYAAGEKKGAVIAHISQKQIELFPIYIPNSPTEQQKFASCLSTMDDLIAAQAEKVEALKKKKTGLMQQLFPQPGETTPRLRFPEFTGEWEEKKLGEIGDVCMCKRIMKHETNPTGGIPFYKIGTFGKKADAFISIELFREYQQKYSYPNKGDILFSAAGTIGRCVVFDGEPAYFQDSNIVWVSNDESKVLNAFLKYIYTTIEWKIDDGGIVKRLYNDSIRKTSFGAPPTLDEQQQIASCLSTLDDQIAAETEKLTALKDYKKGLMQQLLPQPAK